MSCAPAASVPRKVWWSISAVISGSTLIAYRLYVPTSYPDSAPHKLAVSLHGLGGGDVFERADNKLAHMGERYNYLILAPLAYTNGMHGTAWLHDLEGMFDFFNRVSAESSER